MKKILVIDDDFNILEIIELILKSNGYDVQTHTNGFNVPNIVSDYQPDLILLDVRLPYGRLGTELCKELKQVYSIPIVLFSAEHEVSFKECNADDLIEKPFEVNHLLAVLNLHLNLSIRA